MGYGTYCTIADVKNVLGITATTDDTMIRKMCEAASRSIDKYTNRYFHTSSETKYFDGGRILWVPDLLSINASGLKTDEDGDATYENTFATTDYHLYSDDSDNALNVYPKTRIEINPNGDYSSFASGVKKGVQIAGIWGHGDGISATPYVIDAYITSALASGATAISVAAVTNLSAGNLILIDSEQFYIYSIATLALTVEPGVNGTTKSAHDSGKYIYIYQYPAEVRQACIDLASAFYQNRGKQGMYSERIGDYSYTMSKEILYGILQDSIRGYRRINI